MSRPFIVLGTSRRDGNTARAARIAFPDDAITDLNDYAIAPYDYEHRYPEGDAYFGLAEQMTRSDDVVLATPVYWYAMSAQLKLFIDRWSDLITIRKDLGRALTGRRLWVLATSPESALPPGFEDVFRLTANYLAMTYSGAMHIECRTDLEIDKPERAALVAYGQRVLAAGGNRNI